MGRTSNVGLDDGDVEAVARRDRMRAVGVRVVAHDAHVLGAGLDDARAEHRGRHVLGQAERGELARRRARRQGSWTPRRCRRRRSPRGSARRSSRRRRSSGSAHRARRGTRRRRASRAWPSRRPPRATPDPAARLSSPLAQSMRGHLRAPVLPMRRGMPLGPGRVASRRPRRLHRGYSGSAPRTGAVAAGAACDIRSPKATQCRTSPSPANRPPCSRPSRAPASTCSSPAAPAPASRRCSTTSTGTRRSRS